MKKQTLQLFAASATIAVAGSALHAASVDVINENGITSNQLLNSNGGLGSTGFQTSSANGVSLWLRARDQGDDPGPINSSGQFVIQPSTLDTGKFRIDFQFTPEDGDTLPGGSQFNNYQLMLQVDDDPTAGVNYATSPKFVVFDDNDGDATQYVRSPNGDIDDRNDDGDTNDPNETAWETSFTTNDAGNPIPADDQGESITDGSWDDGDSLVIDGITQRGGTTVDFTGSGTLPEWVVVNSWKPEWVPGGGFSTPSGPGLYDIKLSVFDDSGTTELASLESTVQVVPSPTAALAGLGLIGLGLLRRRRA